MCTSRGGLRIVWHSANRVSCSGYITPFARSDTSSGGDCDPFSNGNIRSSRLFGRGTCSIREEIVSGLIYLIGLIVVILFILSFLGLR